MSRLRLRAAALVLVAVSLAACGSSTSADSLSASPSPTPTPTPSSIIWAGDVCVAFAAVKTSVGALGHNLTIKTSQDKSVIDQVSRQLRIQALAIADSVDRLTTTLRAVPVDFVAANDMVANLTTHSDATTSAINDVKSHLDAVGSAGNVIAAAGEVGQALSSAKTAFDAGSGLVSAIGDSTSQAKGQLQEAFAAAPPCQGL